MVKAGYTEEDRNGESMKYFLILTWLIAHNSFGYSVTQVQAAESLPWLEVLMTSVIVMLLGVIGYLWYRNQQLLKAKHKLQALWQHVPDVLTEVDAHGNICELNQSLSEDLSVEKIIGTSSYDYLNKADSDLFREKLKQALNSGEQGDYQLQVKLPESIKYISNQVIPLKLEGPEQRALVISSDVTEHREAQKILQQATKQAEENAQSKSRFLANMSHEIRTPLSGIVGMVTLIEELAEDGELLQYTQPLASSVQHLMRIVDDILDLSKSDGGHIELDESDTSLWHILDDLEALYLPQTQQKHIKFQVVLAANVPRMVKIDAFRLRQVLYNLMSNAIKFTDKGTIVINVSSQWVGEQHLLKFSVKDTGIGINLSKQSLIFDVFRQAQASISRQHGGTGLGLSICRNLVEVMGGVISVESEEGEGADFWFTLPLKPCESSEALGALAHTGVFIAVKDSARKLWFKQFFEALQIPVLEFNSDIKTPKDALLVTDFIKNTEVSWVWWIGEDYDLDLVQGVHLVEPFRREVLCKRLYDYEQKMAGDTAVMSTQDENPTQGKLLLVEDNLTNQLVIRKTLEKMGYQVSIACNGLEGVQAYEQGSFLGIIMDIQMPVMDGIEATKKIRLMQGQYIPIIALTANAQKEVEEACFAAGMDAFLTKPVNRLQLQNTLETVLGSEQQQRQSSA
jgi:PAS domain S-box-containing protein